jgi:two-component system, sensor histidine kinase and response regulator
MTETATHSAPVLEKTISILVVEDDYNLLEGIREILELEHYHVHTAQDGLQALEILRSLDKLPDLIVSDIMMPNMSGTQLLETVRLEPAWVSIPFIFLTARGEKTDIQLGRRLGVDDYVTKPYDPEDLIIAVKSRLERHQRLNDLRADALNQMKRKILTMLNHEFRTPLTFVVAYADMLNMPDPDTMDDDEMMSFLKGVSSGAERLRRLIENFILLVELETGEARDTYNWRKRPLDDLGALLAKARDEMFNRAGVFHACELDMADDLAAVVGDTDYLHQAFCHLLDNAIKFSHADTPVVVQAHNAGNRVVIEFKDQGRGIPAQELDQIWSSFYQINRDYYEDQGAGSGLAIVRRVMDLHGGTIQIASKVGVGTTITLQLPTARD